MVQSTTCLSSSSASQAKRVSPELHHSGRETVRENDRDQLHLRSIELLFVQASAKVTLPQLRWPRGTTILTHKSRLWLAILVLLLFLEQMFLDPLIIFKLKQPLGDCPWSPVKFLFLVVRSLWQAIACLMVALIPLKPSDLVALHLHSELIWASAVPSGCRVLSNSFTLGL
jgi:hypothetical protein